MFKLFKSLHIRIGAFSGLAIFATWTLLTVGSWALGSIGHNAISASAQCNEATDSLLTAGEAALQNNQLTSAEHYAAAVGDQGRKCAKVKEFLAAVIYAEIRALPQSTSGKTARSMFSDCLKAAHEAQEAGDDSTRNDGTIKNCSDKDFRTIGSFNLAPLSTVHTIPTPVFVQKPPVGQSFPTLLPGRGS